MSVQLNHRELSGWASETYVRAAIQRLMQSGWLAAFCPTGRFSDDDLNGVDFWLTLMDGSIMPLQVKSSWHYVEMHRIKYPKLPVVATDCEDIDSAILEQIIGYLEQA